MKTKKFIKEIAKEGYTETNSTGKHRIFKKEGVTQHITLQRSANTKEVLDIYAKKYFKQIKINDKK